MKKYLSSLIILILVSIISSGCFMPRMRDVANRENLSKESRRLEQESIRLEEESRRLEAHSETELTETRADLTTVGIQEEETTVTEAETDSTSNHISIPERADGYNLKIEGYKMISSFDLFINIQTTGNNRIESEPEGAFNIGDKLTYRLEDSDTIILEIEENFGSDLVLNIDLPIKDIDIKGYAVVNIDGQDLPLDSIEVEGIAVVKVQNIDSKELDVDLEGAGQIIASGQAAELDLDVEGAASVDFKNLIVVQAEIDLEGAGHILLSVSDTIKGNIEGVSYLGYYGSPIVDVNAAGISSVEQVSPEIP